MLAAATAAWATELRVSGRDAKLPVTHDHAQLSLGFKCMAVLINRLMLILMVIGLVVAYGFLVISTYPFENREYRLKQVIEQGNFCES